MGKKLNKVLKEGEFLNKYFKTRLLEKNQNVLGGITGGTGSGKSYTALSALDTYYREVLDKPFPVENVVFSVGQFIKRLRYFEENNMRGEILMADEWGVNNAALAFQEKTQRMLSYVMQSFRSMNIGIIMTLPVLTMLAKQTRQLLHFQFITAGINYQNNTSKVKPFLHQLNQQTGKDYWKYPRARANNKWVTLKRLSFSLANPELIKAYEKKKAQFVSNILEEFSEEIDRKDMEEKKKLMRPLLTERQMEIYELLLSGLNKSEVARKLEISSSAVGDCAKVILKKGYKINRTKNP